MQWLAGTWGHGDTLPLHILRLGSPARSRTEGTQWLWWLGLGPAVWDKATSVGQPPHCDCGASSPRAGTAGHGMSSPLEKCFSHWKSSECTNSQELGFARLNAALAWDKGTWGLGTWGHGDIGMWDMAMWGRRDGPRPVAGGAGSLLAPERAVRVIYCLHGKPNMH